MKIVLSDAGKRYNRDWIFRHLNYTFQNSTSYAITGPNGSGKSTLLQALSGAIAFSEGNTRWLQALEKPVKPENIYRQVSICAPYFEVIEELTLKEFLEFHGIFKPFLPGFTPEKISEEILLPNTRNKRINQFSSGMKQRVKLAQCIFSDTPLVLLDEPCTNLDAPGIALYHRLIEQYCGNRLVIVSSNDQNEYDFCREIINIQDYKKI